MQEWTYFVTIIPRRCSYYMDHVPDFMYSMAHWARGYICIFIVYALIMITVDIEYTCQATAMVVIP